MRVWLSPAAVLPILFAVATVFLQPGEADASGHLLRFPWQYGKQAIITGGYGQGDSHQYQDYHALDFKIEGGSTQAMIASAAYGQVVDAVTGRPCGYQYGYGNYVDVRTTITGGNSRYARYAHLSSVSVSSSQTISQGHKVGLQGDTGWTDDGYGGCFVHLHLRWTSQQHCDSYDCSETPEPMSGQTGLAAGPDPITSDNILGPGPDSCSWGTNRLDVVVRGDNNRLYKNWWAGSWHGWENVNGTITADPSCVSRTSPNPPNKLDAFARGTGTPKALWQRAWNGSWGAWTKIGGTLTSGPDASSWSSSRMDVFVRGTDEGVFHKWTEGTVWHPTGYENWNDLGGVVTSDPSSVSKEGSRIDLFARGPDMALWHKWWEPQPVGWQPSQDGWTKIGGHLTSAPDVCSWSSNRIDVFARGTDNGLWHKWWQAGVGWQPAGENNWQEILPEENLVLGSDPTCISKDNNEIDVFMRGSGPVLWRAEWAADTPGGQAYWHLYNVASWPPTP